MIKNERPPLYTAMVEIIGWSLDRTADIPKSHRFTFGQRIDNLSLDALQQVVKAVYSGKTKEKIDCLDEYLLMIPSSLTMTSTDYGNGMTRCGRALPNCG